MDAAAVERAIEDAVAAMQGLHIAVNTAGGGTAQRTIGREGPMPLEAFQRIIDLNLIATFNLNRLQAWAMSQNDPVDDERGVMINTASIAAFGDLPKPAIRVEAVGTQITERVSWDQDTLTHEPQVLGQSEHLWTRTSLRPADCDLALVYDGFTFNAISWIEALGFCGFGEATDWLDGGRRIALDGELPVNPHGGQLSEGRTHGFGFIYEAMTQLRHDAGERQVANAHTAIVTSGGGTPSSVLLLQRDA